MTLIMDGALKQSFPKKPGFVRCGTVRVEESSYPRSADER